MCIRDRRYPPDEEEYEDEQERKRNLMIPIVVVIFLVGVGIFLWVTFFSDLFRSQEEALRVPSLLGEQIDEVNKDQEILKHFKVVETSRQASDQYEEGEIIDQDPDAGTEVTEGEGLITIHVVVSSGKETVEMIDVLGDTYETAVARLQQMDLKVDTPSREPSDEVEEGKVISSDPKAGEKVSPGDTVKLVISSGPDTKPITVPTLTGISLENARSLASGVGLRISNVTEIYSKQPAGQVIYQSIPANTTVEEGTTITLQVSKGPEPETPTPPTTHTKTIDITLPQPGEGAEGATIAVRVTVNGAEAYADDVNPEQGTIYVQISGSGTQEVCVYFDNQLHESYSVNFDE